MVLAVFFGLPIATIVALGVFDWWVIQKWGVEWSISRQMQRLGFAAPWVAFLLGILVGLIAGVLTGHFWWNQPPI